jgi:hypothetical protein
MSSPSSFSFLQQKKQKEEGDGSFVAIAFFFLLWSCVVAIVAVDFFFLLWNCAAALQTPFLQQRQQQKKQKEIFFCSL